MAEENHQSQESAPNEPPLPKNGRLWFESLVGGNLPAKTEWPELVGLTAQEAEPKVKDEMPEAHVQVVPPGCFVTMDFNMKRVRFYINDSAKIDRPPRLG